MPWNCERGQTLPRVGVRKASQRRCLGDRLERIEEAVLAGREGCLRAETHAWCYGKGECFGEVEQEVGRRNIRILITAGLYFYR